MMDDIIFSQKPVLLYQEPMNRMGSWHYSMGSWAAGSWVCGFMAFLCDHWLLDLQ